MKKSTRTLIMIVSLVVAILISVSAILFAATKKEVFFNLTFWTLIIYMAVSLLVWLFFGILHMISKPKKTLIFVAAIIAVVVVAVLISLGDTMPLDFLERYNTSQQTAKLIAIACRVTYFTVIGAGVLMIFSAIAKAFKK